jgi:hypothetical protein
LDEKTREQFILLTLQTLAVRDVVARLLAYEAARREDPMALLRDFSEATDERIHHEAQGLDLGPKTIEAQEILRKEVDWMVNAARVMIDRASPS